MAVGEVVIVKTGRGRDEREAGSLPKIEVWCRGVCGGGLRQKKEKEKKYFECVLFRRPLP